MEPSSLVTTAGGMAVVKPVSATSMTNDGPGPASGGDERASMSLFFFHSFFSLPPLLCSGANLCVSGARWGVSWLRGYVGGRAVDLASYRNQIDRAMRRLSTWDGIERAGTGWDA